MTPNLKPFISDYENGKISLTGIAQKVGRSRERVRQILASKHGIRANTSQARQKLKDEQRKEMQATIAQGLIALEIEKYGASASEMRMQFGPKWDATFNLFRQKRNNERNHGEWKLTFKDWLEVWGEQSLSKKKSLDLCFVRANESKPFQKSNCYIEPREAVCRRKQILKLQSMGYTPENRESAKYGMPVAKLSKQFGKSWERTFRAFCARRTASIRSGLKWRLTFYDWLILLNASGIKIRGKNYPALFRTKKSKAFVVGNVFFQLD